MKALLGILLLLTARPIFAQSSLPYHLSWSGFPFVKSFEKVEKMAAVSYYSEKDVKRRHHADFENIYFDSLGRMISANDGEYDGMQTACWIYQEDGCPSLVSCDPTRSSIVFRKRCTCREGQIDSIFNSTGIVSVESYDAQNRLIKEMLYEKIHRLAPYTFLDSTLFEYDIEGRRVRTIAQNCNVEIQYLQDSIVIQHFRNGILQSTQEIKCGRYGLPVMMQTWDYDNRLRKKTLQIYSTLEYEFWE